jgi:catalase
VLTPEQAVDAINERFGRHPGYRALHAKGTLCRASFTATPEARRLTRAAHMQGDSVEAIVRLSNGSGDPGSPDYASDVRGLAVTFLLSDGSWTDILAQTAPRFPTRTPDGFIDFLRAAAPGWGRLWRLLLFLLRHPGAVGALRALGAATKPPLSYATCTYHPIHAFTWTASDGAERHVRYRWAPAAGVVILSSREARSRGADYLQRELAERLAREPAIFTLELQLATEGDPVNDPTAVWPATRDVVTAGRLEVTHPDMGFATDSLVFDPTRLTDGIKPTDDRVLWFRPGAYAVSVERRTVGRPR